MEYVPQGFTKALLLWGGIAVVLVGSLSIWLAFAKWTLTE